MERCATLLSAKPEKLKSEINKISDSIFYAIARAV